LLVVVALLCLTGAALAADPWVQCTTTDLGAGSWEYQFTIINPIGSGASVYDLILETSSGVINSAPIGTGTGWEFDNVAPTSDWVHWFSPDPPATADIAAGTSLGGFSFQTSAPYTGAFKYTLGSSAGDFTGNASVVPEPGTMAASLALLSPAGISLMWRMRRRRSRTA